MNRFQSINPEKDGAKNKICIITLPNDVFKLWEEFLVKHCEGSLIDPCTGREYREDKKFNPSKFFLEREFFKHMGHFMDKDLKEYALHQLGQTVNRDKVYMPYLTISGLFVEIWTVCSPVEAHGNGKS